MTEDMNKMTDTTTTDQPPAPNGHGDSNSMRPPNAAAESSALDVPSATKNKHKNKSKKQRHQHHQKPASMQADAVAAVTTVTQSPPNDSVEQLEPPVTIKFKSETLDGRAAVARTPNEESTAAPTEESTAAQIEETTAVRSEEPAAKLRVRMKVWTDPTTAKRYLVPSAFMRDLLNGQPISDAMYAYALRDDDTQTVLLTAGEWQALPFVYVQEDGPAPRPKRTP
jgi:hypothetical protein